MTSATTMTSALSSEKSSVQTANDHSQLADLVQSANVALEEQSAEQRVSWAMQELPGPHIVVSNFALESAALLHLATQMQSDIPVLLIDTGYLYPETYRYAEQLRDALALNLHVYRPTMSSARQEAKFGKLWTQGEQGMQTYQRLNMLEPLERALTDFRASTWLQESTGGGDTAGADSKGGAEEHAMLDGERLRVAPLLDWSADDVRTYLQRYGLPTHPLAEQGYMQVGDVHAGDRPGA